MTHTANHARPALRRAAALLLAAAAFPSTALAQETVTPPTVMVPAQPVPAPAPAPVTRPEVQAPPTTTTTSQTPPGESRTTIAPGAIEQVEQEARERAAARQAEARQAQARQTRAARAAAPAAPAPAPVVEAAPVPEAATPEALPAAPVPADPVVQSAPVEPLATDTVAAPVEEAASGGSIWLIVAALGGIAVVIAGAMLLRRRREDEPYIEEAVVAAAPVAAPVEPVAERKIEARHVGARTERPVADPVAAAPVFAGFVAPRPEPEPVEARILARSDAKSDDRPALENAELVDADPADVAALLGDSKPGGSRPQLELAMRPIRAGMSRRGAMVGFELTVANAGGVAADDVRIGAFMLGENAARDSEIERLLVNPPVDSILPADRIAPGDGTTLEGSVTMSREQVDAIAGDDQGFTPVLVADARYRLPDGREGRTAAAFKIGRVNGGAHLVPIAIQDDPSMYADIEAELVGVPSKV